METKQCVNGADPNAIFLGELNGGEEFWEAPELEILAGQIIKKKLPDFPADASVRYLWKLKGSADAIGKCIKLSGLPEFGLKADYAIWLSAEYVREMRFTNWQVEALLYHELCHVTVEETQNGQTKLKVRKHDLEAFRSEVEEYGFWAQDLQSFARAVQRQLSFEDVANQVAPPPELEPDFEDLDLPPNPEANAEGMSDEERANAVKMGYLSTPKVPSLSEQVMEAVAEAVNDGALDGDGVTVTAEVVSSGSGRGKRKS